MDSSEKCKFKRSHSALSLSTITTIRRRIAMWIQTPLRVIFSPKKWTRTKWSKKKNKEEKWTCFFYHKINFVEVKRTYCHRCIFVTKVQASLIVKCAFNPIDNFVFCFFFRKFKLFACHRRCALLFHRSSSKLYSKTNKGSCFLPRLCLLYRRI